ncbi:hypothetical protein Q4503_07475 [Colwellia sp. 6_MG-2023]|uniref:hypothetical protein n=1 Tax=Colwellia sp. 6_MG-2023 TaxID=3062676 RepID=UPI0026E1C8E8|nr:hypothetical protein [Colwellia sp. 6_MG-2023]MDO6487537.1 hypothetical protein [Colwellia sp. 6_MG-2023]
MLTEWVLRSPKEWQNDAMNFIAVMLPSYGKGTVKQVQVDPKSSTPEYFTWI